MNLAKFLQTTLLTTTFFSLMSYSHDNGTILLADDFEEEEYVVHTPLDATVGAGGYLMNHLTDIENGSRSFFKISFNRLSKHIALDLRIGTGEEYTDMGGGLRLFKHWIFGNETRNSTGFTLGGGFGGVYSDGFKGIVPSLGADVKKPFMDLHVAPFAQFVWDWGNGVGLALEAEYLFVFKRQFLDEDTRDAAEKDEVVTDDFRNRINFGISLMFEV